MMIIHLPFLHGISNAQHPHIYINIINIYIGTKHRTTFSIVRKGLEEPRENSYEIYSLYTPFYDFVFQGC